MFKSLHAIYGGSLVPSPPPSFSIHALESLGTRLPIPHAQNTQSGLLYSAHIMTRLIIISHAQHFQIQFSALKIPSFGPFWHKSISTCRAPISSDDCLILSYARSAFYKEVRCGYSHMCAYDGRQQAGRTPSQKQPCCLHTHPCPSISIHADCWTRYYNEAVSQREMKSLVQKGLINLNCHIF